MKRKFLDGSHWTWLQDYRYQYQRIEGAWSGYIACIWVDKVKEVLKVTYQNREVILCDNGFSGVIFLPDNAHWCASAVYNQQQEIVEWYFDITKVNSITSEGVPYFDDLYLDVVVAPDFKTRLLDEDELAEACDEGIITEEDVALAYATSSYLKEYVIPNKDFMVAFLSNYLSEHTKRDSN